MPINLTESESYDANIQVPVDTDAGVVASVNVAFQSLANRAKFFLKRIIGAEAGDRDIVIMAPQINVSSRFAFNSTGVVGWRQDNVTDVGGLWFQIKRPKKGRIKKIRAQVRGGTGRGSPPGTYPVLSLVESEWAGWTSSTLASKSDPNTGLGAYETDHTIEIVAADFSGGNGTPFDVEDAGGSSDNSRNLFIVFTGETGGGAAASKLQLVGLVVEYDPS